MADGVLYVACGDRYVEAAAASARSVRAVMPGVPIALGTDGPAPDGFDQVVPVAEPDGYRAKIRGMLASPFDRTLALDADTYAAADVSEAFGVLDEFDVAAAHAPNRVTLDLDDVPDSFPELNTGVIAFRRNERVQRLLEAWLEEYDRLAPQKPPSKDQPSFRRALYRADVRPAVLPPEFNLRFWMAGFHNQPVRILHGWADADTYARVAALLNERATSRRHRAVFAGRTLLDERAEVVGRFPERPERPS
ncbi:MAG TPA: hypothetical protein VFB35_03105 [Gaiellaceae bacterium]|nr:hypothetical protein [Gaiellaceae bacterium]